MYFLVIFLWTHNLYYVTNKKVDCLDRLVWVRFVADLLDEFCQRNVRIN